MFELTSNRGNKVKVINVTEARAKFAAVLSDCDSAYVITKNNKPQRVIIDYEEFQRLQKEAALRQGTNPDEGERIPGLNQVKREESGDGGTTPEAPEENKTAKELAAQNRDPSEKNTKQSAVKGLLRQSMEQVQLSDYFGAEEGPSYGQEENVEHIKEPERFLKDVQTEETPPIKHTSEEDAYFQKYRKLYEGRSPQSTPFQTEANDEQKKPEDGPAQVLTRAAEDGADTEKKDLSIEKIIKPKELQNYQNPASQPPGDPVAEENLPSLEDLLKDLDIDLIGDDSGALSEQEINNLIHRITSD